MARPRVENFHALISTDATGNQTVGAIALCPECIESDYYASLALRHFRSRFDANAAAVTHQRVSGHRVIVGSYLPVPDFSAFG